MTDLDIPATFVVDVVGLPPARARLARLTAWNSVLDGRSLQLGENRERLVAAQGEVAALEARLAEAVENEAQSLLASIRDGAAWALSAISGKERVGLDAQLSAARHRQEVGAAALLELDKEIAVIRATMAALESRIADAVVEALREHAAATTGAEYTATLALLREQLTRLEGVARLAADGHEGRVAFAAPGYRESGHDGPFAPVVVAAPDLEESVATWWRLAAAWRDDAHADPAEHLVFGPLVEDPAYGIAYDRLSQPERDITDRQFAGLDRRT